MTAFAEGHYLLNASSLSLQIRWKCFAPGMILLADCVAIT